MNYYAEVSLTSAAPTNVDVYALQPTWYVLGALKAAKQMHDKAMKEERSIVNQARWYDFRISHDFPTATYAEGEVWGFNQGLTAVAVHSAAELSETVVTDHAGVDRVFTLRGATGSAVGANTAFNVFQEFDQFGNVDDDAPAVGGATAPYTDLIGQMDSENVLNLTGTGTNPPYNQNSWDAVWVRVGQLLISATGTQTVSTGVFQAPLGVVLLSGYSTALAEIGASPNATIHVVPGNTKGVLTTAL